MCLVHPALLLRLNVYVLKVFMSNKYDDDDEIVCRVCHNLMN